MSDNHDHPDTDLIARLTAELESERKTFAVSKAFHDSAVGERDRAWRTIEALKSELAKVEAERDEARALLAILYGEEGMGNVTPADASTALAARDAAMRNEGRRQAAGIVDAECARVLSKQDGGLPEVDRTLRMMCLLLPDISDAILAALEPEGGE